MARIRAWTVAAAAIGCCVVLAAVPAAAEPSSMTPAPAVAPGIDIGIYGPNGGPDVNGCTAGWLVHGADGQPGLLTAGHCFHGGGATYLNTNHGFIGIGRFIHHVYNGDGGDDADIAELGIGNYPGAPSVDTDTRIIGIRPVVAPADDARLANGQVLCHYGAASGPPNHGPQCGPITYLTANNVVFDAPNAPGDSGGPVYYRNADGTAAPVGVEIRGDSTGTVAELIGPWLQRWNLTVDTTTPPGGRAPVGFQRPR